MVSRILCAVLVLLMAGCTTVSPEQRAQACGGTDWVRFGVNDGKLGVPIGARASLFEECAGVGKPVDQTAYRAGRAEGLVDYCTVETGYRVGYSGRRYYRVCPPALEADFLQGFGRGRSEAPRYAAYPSIGVGIGVGVGRYRYRHPGPYTPPYWCGFWFPGCR